MFVQMMTPMMLDMLDGRKTHTLSLSFLSSYGFFFGR